VSAIFLRLNYPAVTVANRATKFQALIHVHTCSAFSNLLCKAL